MHFSSFILGFALFLVLSLSQSAQARGDFSHSCLPELSIEGTNILQAFCKDGSGNVINTVLDLNKCIGIGKKSLIYQLKYAGLLFCIACFVGKF